MKNTEWERITGPEVQRAWKVAERRTSGLALLCLYQTALPEQPDFLVLLACNSYLQGIVDGSQCRPRVEGDYEESR